MEDKIYCVFLRPGSAEEFMKYSSGPELIGVFDNEQSAKTVMDLVDVIFGNYTLKISDDDADSISCFCMEYPKNEVRYNYLKLLNDMKKES